MTSTLRLATRDSPLAWWQANFVANQLQQAYPQLKIELIGFKTSGDRLLDSSLADKGGKGLFIKELEIALIENKADIAVHSLKDLPVTLATEFCLAAICERDDPRDVLVSQHYATPEELPLNAKIGTSSLRRHCQFKKIIPNVNIIACRGNLGTRLAKLARGEYDALLLAAAGIKRLAIPVPNYYAFSTADFIPAVAQGAIGIECLQIRQAELAPILQPLHHEKTAQCILAERAFNVALNGGCHLPIAAFAEWLTDDTLQMTGMVGDPATETIIRAQISGDACDPAALGQQLARELLQRGAVIPTLA